MGAAFPKARCLIGRREHDFWSAHDDKEQQAMLGDSVKPIFDAGLVQQVEQDPVISPEIRLIPSIGHTPGHVSVMIESEGRRAVITGDRAHHPATSPARAKHSGSWCEGGGPSARRQEEQEGRTHLPEKKTGGRVSPSARLGQLNGA